MIYRVHFTDDVGESQGYVYYPSLAAMDKGVKGSHLSAGNFCCKFSTPRTKKDNTRP